MPLDNFFFTAAFAKLLAYRQAFVDLRSGFVSARTALIEVENAKTTIMPSARKLVADLGKTITVSSCTLDAIS